jgi:hypothetical protein
MIKIMTSVKGKRAGDEKKKKEKRIMIMIRIRGKVKELVSKGGAVMQYIKQKAALMATFCDCVFLIKDRHNAR